MPGGRGITEERGNLVPHTNEKPATGRSTGPGQPRSPVPNEGADPFLPHAPNGGAQGGDGETRRREEGIRALEPPAGNLEPREGKTRGDKEKFNMIGKRSNPNEESIWEKINPLLDKKNNHWSKTQRFPLLKKKRNEGNKPKNPKGTAIWATRKRGWGSERRGSPRGPHVPERGAPLGAWGGEGRFWNAQRQRILTFSKKILKIFQLLKIFQKFPKKF